MADLCARCRWALAVRPSPIDRQRVCWTDYAFERRTGRERTEEQIVRAAIHAEERRASLHP